MRLPRHLHPIAVSALSVVTLASGYPSGTVADVAAGTTASAPQPAVTTPAPTGARSDVVRASRFRSMVHLPEVTTTTTPVPVPAAAEPVPAPSAAPVAAAAARPAPTTAPPTTSAPKAAAPKPAAPKAPPTTKAAAPVAQTSGSVNDFLLRSLNAERTARGLNPLALDSTLSSMARTWSATMAAAGAMSHSGSGIPGGFNAFGENVLKGSGSITAGQMHNMWMASSGHRKQMLQPGFDRVGIAAVCVNGSVYATETFGHSSAAGDPQLSDAIPDATPEAPVSGGPTCS